MTTKPRTLSCGCCTQGCICWTHSRPDNRRLHVCAYHQDEAQWQDWIAAVEEPSFTAKSPPK